MTILKQKMTILKPGQGRKQGKITYKITYKINAGKEEDGGFVN